MPLVQTLRTRSLAAVLALTLLVSVSGCQGQIPRPPMQFDYPSTTSAPVPLAVYIHGGGWIAGDRISDGYYNLTRDRLLAAGVAVASLDYRLAPRHRFPAQINDVTYAVRYFRSKAKQLRIDPDRIAAYGTSAGGHLASLVGTADRSAGFDVGALAGVSSRVRAVVDIVGPVDLTDPTIPLATTTAIQATFGTTAAAGGGVALGQASPVSYITADDPPFLVVHGTADELVPYQQSVVFAERLNKAGVRAELVPVVGATHGLNTPGQSPSPAQLVDRITIFLVTELRR